MSKPKTVLVTGASSGIGKAIVDVFAMAGWNVAATSRKANTPVTVNVKSYKLDVTKPDEITKAFEKIIDDYGSIDVVVNNAGYGLDGVFEAMTEQQIKDQFETNVFGLMNVTRQAIAHMRPRQSGTIIQISSMGGRVTFPLYSIYNASKWAVEGFTESLQYELRQFNVRLKLIEPGVIKTDFYGKSKVEAIPNTKLGYDDYIKRVGGASSQAGNSGEDPVKVARVVLRAATSNSTKLRYAVGRPSPQLILARRLVPERVFFWMIGRFLKS